MASGDLCYRFYPFFPYNRYMDSQSQNPPKPKDPRRKGREAEALRANLARRKEQARAQQDGDE